MTSRTMSLLIVSLLATSSAFAQKAQPSQTGENRVDATTQEGPVVPAQPGADEGPLRYQTQELLFPEPLPLPDEYASIEKKEMQPSAAVTKDGLLRSATGLKDGAELVPGGLGDLTMMSIDPEHSHGDFDTQDFGGLSAVSCSQCFPYAMNVHLSIQWPDGNWSGASGALIDSRHVLTAGHCVYSHDNGGWARRIITTPGRDGSFAPYGTSEMETVMSWSAWTNNEDFEHDIAVIRLARPVGALTGWFGYGYTSSSSWFESPSWNLGSYPGSPYSQVDMYFQAGDFDTLPNSYEARRRTPGIPGQSGSAAYKFIGSGRYAYAVTSHNFWNWFHGTDLDSVRLTSNKFVHVNDFISARTHNTPDLLPLDVNAGGTYFPRGGYITGVNYLTHNYSKVGRSGTVNTRVYLSTNDNISSSDTLVQSHYFNWSFGSKSSVRVNASSVYVPTNLSPGWYYLGVIVQDSDAELGNNDSDGQDAVRVYIY
ncbi:MAG: trypsin-like serine protease [Planctomycetota bacterium]